MFNTYFTVLSLSLDKDKAVKYQSTLYCTLHPN